MRQSKPRGYMLIGQSLRLYVLHLTLMQGESIFRLVYTMAQETSLILKRLHITKEWQSSWFIKHADVSVQATSYQYTEMRQFLMNKKSKYSINLLIICTISYHHTQFQLSVRASNNQTILVPSPKRRLEECDQRPPKTSIYLMLNEAWMKFKPEVYDFDNMSKDKLN